MGEPTVYRSTHDAALAAWDAAHARAEEIGKARRALLDELGFAGRPALIDERDIIGVQHLPEHGPIPSGWRHDRDTSNAIVPDKRNREGKTVAEKLGKLRMPGRGALLVGGLPEMALDLDTSRAHWPSIARMDGAIYVRYGCDPEKKERGNRIDFQIWERIKLSEYYLAVEAEAQRTTTDPAEAVTTDA
jgi:hypothetical protein